LIEMSGPSAAYKSVIKQLYARNVRFPVSLGLANSYKLYQALGSPLEHTPVIHVAGTNGKVCLKQASIVEILTLVRFLFCRDQYVTNLLNAYRRAD
jgi:folylpolyglutamate synthase/dihydropteroate synthase